MKFGVNGVRTLYRIAMAYIELGFKEVENLFLWNVLGNVHFGTAILICLPLWSMAEDATRNIMQGHSTHGEFVRVYLRTADN